MEDKEEQPEKAPSAIVVTDSDEHHRKDSLKIFHF